MGLMIAIIVLCVVIGIPATLFWWKIADRWADTEHKRFPQRSGGPAADGTGPTVVDPDPPARS